MQIDAFPQYFLDKDWFSLYYNDVYERETRHITLDVLTDVDNATRHDFLHFMTNVPDLARLQGKKQTRGRPKRT